MSPEGNSSDESRLSMQETNFGWPCPHKKKYLSNMSNIQLSYRYFSFSLLSVEDALEQFLNFGEKKTMKILPPTMAKLLLRTHLFFNDMP
jgi:hypothetical protein